MFHKWKVDDEWFTPSYVWQDVLHVVSYGSKVWEPFVGDGESSLALEKIGFEVVRGEGDFFNSSKLADIVVTNPPYSCLDEVMDRLIALETKFVLLLPIHRLVCHAMRLRLRGMQVTLIIPSKRVNFRKPGVTTGRCPFYSVFLCVGFVNVQSIFFVYVIVRRDVYSSLACSSA